jgi:hypothetical protein
MKILFNEFNHECWVMSNSNLFDLVSVFLVIFFLSILLTMNDDCKNRIFNFSQCCGNAFLIILLIQYYCVMLWFLVWILYNLRQLISFIKMIKKKHTNFYDSIQLSTVVWMVLILIANCKRF